MLRALLFDLDGTLIDTAPELAEALNRSLAWLGRPCVDAAQVRGWIGDGARALLERALGAPPSDAVWEHFAYEYGECCGTLSTLYPGTLAMLERLHAGGLRLAVLTNKESRFAHKLLTVHGISPLFELLVAGDTTTTRKPDPGVVRHALEALQVGAAEAALVGDSPTDVRTARAAGLRAWVVSHGYPQTGFDGADAPDDVIASFADFDPCAAATRLTAIH